MNFKESLQKIERPQKIFAAAIAAVFLFSLIVYAAKTSGSRYVFRFQSVDSGRANIEWRLLPRRKGSEKTSVYVDELLLGPKTERARPIFSPGTKAEFCFERDRVLYVGLSEDLLEKSGNASEIMEGIELFKLNVKKSFPLLKKVEIYIGKKGLLQIKN